MTYNNNWKPTENNISSSWDVNVQENNIGQPMNWQPTPQTPEQVDEGLRAAFREAKKNGVMDATPYLKQMTFNSDIEKKIGRAHV